jgi:predicted RNA-binding Zn-ribbon protein involved in translation (DUF1610 family)
MNARCVGKCMSEKNIEPPTLEELLQRSIVQYRCPHCGIQNPIIRAVEGYKSPCGIVMIYSCMACKHIINCGLK